MPLIDCWLACGCAGAAKGAGMAGAVCSTGAESTRTVGDFVSVLFFATFFAAGFFGVDFAGIGMVMPGIFI
ncbi:MAG: hypothetical protein JO335_00650 [Sphingomonas sp.]|nr:hypothetical protein [Sphingomonas sp.]